MAVIIATRPILYGGRMYDPGAQLPATDARMVEAWLTHGSARESVPAENPLTDTAEALPEAEKTETETEETEETAPAAPPIPAPAVRGRATKRQG